MKNLTTTVGLLSSTVLIGASQLSYSAPMETTLVTATRTQQTIDSTLAPVTVIDREDIERAQARDVLELLSQTTGISITRNGGTGSNSSVFIRGNASTHTLVLIDGQRVGSATLGSASLSTLEPEQIERIEIVRGPRSSLYGSDAIGGVIQIFTRKGSINGEISPLVKAAYGNHNTSKAVLGLSGGDDAFFFNLQGTHFDTQGIDNLKNDSGNNGDLDAYRTSGNSLRSGGRIGQAEIDVSYQRTESQVEFDNNFSPTSQPYIESVVESGNAAISMPIISNWMSSLRVGKSKDDSLTLDDRNSSRSKFTTQRDSATWQNDISINHHVVSVGAEYYTDKVDSTTKYDVDERYNKAGFAQVQSDYGRHDVLIGARHEDNEQFGSYKTWNTSYGLDVDDSKRLILSRGTAFKAPSFNQLYFPGFGNPNFVPEESDNTEIEFRYSTDQGGWSLAAFENDVENLIQYNPATFNTDQISEVEIRGGELTANWLHNNWIFNANLTVLRPIDKATNNDVRRRPRRTATLSADRSFEQFSLGFVVYGQGQSYEDAANNRKLSSFTLLDARAAYAFNADLKLQLSLKNLLNKEYETTRGYDNPGLTSMLTVIYEPK